METVNDNELSETQLDCLKMNYQYCECGCGAIAYGKIVWHIDDVHSVRKQGGYAELTDEQVMRWWSDNERHFKDNMIQRGWEILSDMISISEVSNE